MSETHRHKCRIKTVNGNVFASRRSASGWAKLESRRRGHRLIAYECVYCGRFHVGRPIPDGKPVPKAADGEQPRRDS